MPWLRTNHNDCGVALDALREVTREDTPTTRAAAKGHRLKWNLFAARPLFHLTRRPSAASGHYHFVSAETKRSLAYGI